MRIGIDARSLEEEKISGVGEYTREIIENLLRTDRKNEYIIFSNSYTGRSDNFSFLAEFPNAKLKRFRLPNKILNFCLWYFKRPKLDTLLGGVDIFFAPNINFLALSGQAKLITTFHDLSFERYAEFFSRKSRLWHYWFVNPRKIARDSYHTIAVSQSTKNDLEQLYNLPPEKISSVYHGIDEGFRLSNMDERKILGIRAKYGLPEKFILFLGNVESRKNITSIVSSYRRLREVNSSYRAYKMVLAGKITKRFRDIAKEAGIETLGYIDREDRAYVLRLASLFVYPSFFEGFGLPLLEAMACGVPIICSNNSSLPEVSGDAAVTINPLRPEELCAAMRAALSDKELLERLRGRGIARSKNFNWTKCAAETLSVFRKQYANRN